MWASQAGRTLGDRGATDFGATSAAIALLEGMKKMTKTSKQIRTTLHLAKETVRTLNSEDLEVVQGGLGRTSFSCPTICISINAC